MNLIPAHRLPRRSLFALSLIFVGACNQTPTEITPLPRALGEVGAVRVQMESLAPLDPIVGGAYVLWGLGERNQASKLGAFFIDPTTGDVVDANGSPVDTFTTDEVALRTLQGILVTIEVNPEAESPTGMQIISGTFIDRVAELTVPISSSITSASGTLRVFTPTDGPDTNENSGVWMVDAAGEPSLNMPDTSAALQYETFIEIGGQNLNIGRFDLVDRRDDHCRFCAKPEADHIRTGIVFGHGQCAYMLAGTQFGQVALLLFFAAVLADLVDAQVGMGAVGQPHRGGGATDLLHGHAVSQVTQVRAAVLFLHGDAQQAHVTELWPQVCGKQVVQVDLFSAWCNLRLCELKHRIAQHVDVFTQVKVQHGIGRAHNIISLLIIVSMCVYLSPTRFVSDPVRQWP